MRTILVFIMIAMLIGCAAKKSGPALSESAQDAAFQNKYEPVVIDGMPTGVWCTYQVKIENPLFDPNGTGPTIISQPDPDYPKKALESDQEGTVVIKAYLDEHGKVKKVIVADCNNPGWGFERAAEKAAYKAEYAPAVSFGKPLPCWIEYNVEFVLDDK